MAGQPNMYSRLFWLLIMHVSYFWGGIVRAQERSKNPLMWRWESQHGCIHCGRAIWCLPDYNYLAARLAGQVVRRFSGRWFLLRETNAMNTGLYHPFISIYSDFGGTLVFFFLLAHRCVTSNLMERFTTLCSFSTYLGDDPHNEWSVQGFAITNHFWFGEDEKAHTMSCTILGCCEATMLGPYAVMGIYLTFLEGAHSWDFFEGEVSISSWKASKQLGTYFEYVYNCRYVCKGNLTTGT